MTNRTEPALTTISAPLIEQVCRRLAEGKSVRRALPHGGRLHIDRPLPFLCLVRQRPGYADESVAKLITGEAAYLIAPGDPQHKAGLARLIQQIAIQMSEKFGAFLLLEVWAAPALTTNSSSESLPPRPAFKIITSKARPPTAAIESLAKSLKRIKLLKQPAQVDIVYHKKRAPTGLAMPLPSKIAQKIHSHVIGLEIEPFYRNPATQEVYPVLLRSLHRRLASAFKRAFFDFARTQTSYAPINHYALGRRALVRPVWDVDRKLAEVSSSFDFLLQVTPVNIQAAWAAFKRQHYERAPQFYYRPMPIDPAQVKARLFQIPINRVEDPTLATLFRQKRTELDRMLSMLSDRGSRHFLYGSLQLFGGVNSSLLKLAGEIVGKISPHSREKSTGPGLNAIEFAREANTELACYRQIYPDLTATVQIREDTVGLMVSNGNLLIGRDTRIARSRVEALLQHEVGTHVLTYFNGRAQPFQQLYTGLAGYEELQEGLAVLAEYLVGGLSRPRLRLLAGRVIAVHCLIDGASFIDTFRVLQQEHGFKPQTAFTITARVFRGGGLTKDAVYLRGLVGVLEYLHSGGELAPLFVGKIAANHLPIIKELQSRQVFRPIPLMPRYLNHPHAARALAHLKQGVSVINLIERKRL